MARGGLGAVGLFGLHSRLEIWNRWDAISYLELAQFGYRPPGTLRQFSVVFFPPYRGKKPLLECAITVWSLLYLALFSSAFVRGLWAF